MLYRFTQLLKNNNQVEFESQYNSLPELKQWLTTPPAPRQPQQDMEEVSFVYYMYILYSNKTCVCSQVAKKKLMPQLQTQNGQKLSREENDNYLTSCFYYVVNRNINF